MVAVAAVNDDGHGRHGDGHSGRPRGASRPFAARRDGQRRERVVDRVEGARTITGRQRAARDADVEKSAVRRDRQRGQGGRAIIEESRRLRTLQRFSRELDPVCLQR